MARVEGFEPANSGQEPDVAVGVWGDSDSGVGVFGTSGALPPGVDNIPAFIAGVEGHSIQNPGVAGESVEFLGVLGRSARSSGVLGVTFSPSIPGQPPDSHGVFGASTAGGNGVVGFVGEATGVIGNSIRGTGVRGISAGHGVVGESVGGEATIGVFGRNVTGRGVQGASTTGIGVDGFSFNGFGVRGESTNNNGVDGFSFGGGNGVQGVSPAGTGVNGSSSSGFGVRGASTSNHGVFGTTNGLASGVAGTQVSNEVGSGVDGTSVLGTGVNGFSFAGTGVQGTGRDRGVYGATSTISPFAAGVVGEKLGDPNLGFAGIFLGNVRITGSLSKAGGGFEIDHPLDPENKYLCHSFVESPDMLNVYSGNVTTDATGEASVTLPEYFEALNQDCRYQLTVIGQFAQAIVAQEIRNNQFTIKTDQPRVKVSWQVTGIRRDPWAVANRITVEEEKAAEQKGRYLHPELYGQPEEARMYRSPQREDQLRRISQLVPEQLRQRVEQQLQALLRGDHVDPEELQGLLVEARQLSEPPLLPAEPPRIDLEEPRIDRARLEEEWRQVEQLVQRMRP